MAGFLSGPPGRGQRGRYRPLAEINVTPLVDVMLVLLIIFMVTAPLMTSGVPVDLPKTTAQPINSDSEPLTVSIDAQGGIFLQDQSVQLPELVGKLQAIAQNNADRRIFVRGDKDLAYGRIMEVMGTITQGGFTKVALLAEAPSAAPPGGSAPAMSAPSVPTPGAAPAPSATPASRGPSAPTRKGG
jgi:biopolymer transport protein TolR